MAKCRFRTPAMRVRFLHGPPYAGVAQLVGHLICTQAVVGSIPITSSKCSRSPMEEALVLGTNQCGFESHR